MKLIETPGFYDGVSAADYHADCCIEPSLSSSVAKDLLERSPAYVRHHHPRFRSAAKKAAESEETEAMSFGSVVHELALGTGGGFAVWDGASWRGNEAKAFRAAAIAAGETPIKQADYLRACGVVESIRFQLDRMDLGFILEGGKSEQVAVWKSRGCWMRAMFDRWLPDRQEIWDIKTIGSPASPERIARQMAQMQYHMRAEFYLMGASAITGLPAIPGGVSYRFLFVETSPPVCVTPCHLDASFREHGRKLANEAIATWARCMESGIWPAHVTAPVEIAAPGWIDFEIEDTGITESGARIA